MSEAGRIVEDVLADLAEEDADPATLAHVAAEIEKVCLAEKWTDE